MFRQKENRIPQKITFSTLNNSKPVRQIYNYIILVSQHQEIKLTLQKFNNFIFWDPTEYIARLKRLTDEYAKENVQIRFSMEKIFMFI